MVLEKLWGTPVLRVIITIIIAVGIAKIISSTVKLIIRHLAKKNNIEKGKLPLGRAEWLVMALIVLGGIHFSIPLLNFGELLNMAKGTLNTLEIVFAGFLLIAIVDIIIELYLQPFVNETETKLDDQVLYWAHKVSHTVIVVITLLYVLIIWGVDPVPLLGSLGIAGLAVALALRPTLENIFSGVSLIVDKTFQLEDLIKLDSGEIGSVYKIGLRTTRIKTFDNEIIIIPNSILANSKLENLNQPDRKIRTSVEFGVEYGVDPEYIKKIVLEKIEAMDVRDQNKDVKVMFKSMGDSALIFKVMIWADDLSKKWPINQEAITRIYRRLYKEGIGIPFPQQTVWLRDEGKAKGLSPFDKKYSSVKGKYLSNWGREYEEKPKKAKKVAKKKKSSLLSKLKRKKK